MLAFDDSKMGSRCFKSESPTPSSSTSSSITLTVERRRPEPDNECYESNDIEVNEVVNDNVNHQDQVNHNQVEPTRTRTRAINIAVREHQQEHLQQPPINNPDADLASRSCRTMSQIQCGLLLLSERPSP